jgi:hypothetical protein
VDVQQGRYSEYKEETLLLALNSVLLNLLLKFRRNLFQGVHRIG